MEAQQEVVEVGVVVLTIPGLEDEDLVDHQACLARMTGIVQCMFYDDICKKSAASCFIIFWLK